ncbi:hypothetical protein H0H87_009170 [Tephrocybe sp. NHM501043]|nr:hypothetical protein H0H87_009170 [Tephrocybe sp. NHM501043]
MVNIVQVVFSLLGICLPTYITPDSNEAKSIAIIGAGSAGLAMLKTIVDLPESTNWNVVLFDEREDIGGVWLPHPHPGPPPAVPDTPLYPLLRTNTPVPSMSYPKFPFTTGIHLYPSHKDIQAYHVRFAEHHNITQFMRFRHKVLKTSWNGDEKAGHWDVTYRDALGRLRHGTFNHLVVATGNNHIPRIPLWPGQDNWLSNSSNSGFKREILHTVWYRGPHRYAGLRVLIVGAGSSGRDIGSQIVPLAAKLYVSVRHDPDPLVGPIVDGAIPKPDISHFTGDGVVFSDGSILNVDVILLATGYEIRKPFLEEGNVLITDYQARFNNAHPHKLVTNTRYIFPLHRHIFSLSPSYPVNALAFIGLPSAIANCPSDIAQSLFAAHAILNSTLLPSRDELLQDLAEREDVLRKAGYDPYNIGHRLPTNTSSDYQDELVDFLKDKPPKPTIERGEWDRRLHEVQVTKNDLNRLIMDYLVIEGYKAAAEEFSQEADIAPPVDFESIESRMSIREALQRGDIEDAITRVNDLNPEILDTNPALYFHLQQQKLIEYIRQGRIGDALQFAQSELAPRGEESPEFLSELERTMALLAFEGSGMAPASIAELMSPGQRMKMAGEVNGAILESLSQGKEVKLAGLLKLLGWGEELLGEKTEFPQM